VRHEARQISVIGQEQEPFGLDVEPADRLDRTAQPSRNQVEDRVAALLIRGRRDEAAGFVQEDVRPGP
jgi:hypothetical protein